MDVQREMIFDLCNVLGQPVVWLRRRVDSDRLPANMAVLVEPFARRKRVLALAKKLRRVTMFKVHFKVSCQVVSVDPVYQSPASFGLGPRNVMCSATHPTCPDEAFLLLAIRVLQYDWIFFENKCMVL